MTLHLPWHFTSASLETSISEEKLPESAGFFSYGFVFSFFVVALGAKFTFSLTLKEKYDLEEPAHLSFPCMLLPPGF